MNRDMIELERCSRTVKHKETSPLVREEGKRWFEVRQMYASLTCHEATPRTHRLHAVHVETAAFASSPCSKQTLLADPCQRVGAEPGPAGSWWVSQDGLANSRLSQFSIAACCSSI